MLPTALTLHVAARSIQSGKLSCADYIETLIERALSNVELNAFIYFDPERLLNEARRADERQAQGECLGPLHGIPLAIKDCIDIKGLPTTAATPMLRDNLANQTAPLVQSMLEAGALLFGKTNMHELAFGITSNNECTGAIRNPYDPERSAGGSSSGSAVAVATGMVPAAIGTDTAGSVRIPAAHCGIFGFRPSLGRYDSMGVMPLFPTRDVPGLMTRSIEDLCLLDSVLTGDTETPPYTVASLRLGIPRDYFLDELEAVVARAFEQELERLAALGAILVEVDLPDVEKCIAMTNDPIRAWELPRSISAYLLTSGSGIDFHTLINGIAGSYVRQEFTDALKDTESADLEERYRTAVTDSLPCFRNQYCTCLKQHCLDAIIFPTTPLLPIALGEETNVFVDGSMVSVWQTMRNTEPASFFGAPGISVPLPRGLGEMPIGLEFDGIPGSDRKLLSVVAACTQL